MNVTSIEQLKKISKGQVVELLGWGEESFVCRLKRPSLLGLVASGKIPNPMLNAAYILFNGPQNSKDVISLNEKHELLTIIAKESLVEPKYEQLEEMGLELTDAQLSEIWNYSQAGVNALVSFRKKQQNLENNKYKPKVQGKAK
ncbi:hypothetical protein ABFP60_02200 [Clostridioides difficile]